MTTAIPRPRTDGAGAPTSAWLTRLRLNLTHRAVHKDLADVGAMHRRIMSVVPDRLGDTPRATAGALFRVETDQPGAPVVLVQSRIAPDTSRLPDGYAEADTRPMTPMLIALRAGTAVRYRLLGNTIRRCGPNSTAGHWKQAIALRDEDAVQWWIQRADSVGLTLHTASARSMEALTAYRSRPGVDPGPPAPQQKKSDLRIPYAATLFEGTATVSDAEALKSAVLAGVGRGKSYGFGLLSLAPNHN